MIIKHYRILGGNYWNKGMGSAFCGLESGIAWADQRHSMAWDRITGGKSMTRHGNVQGGTCGNERITRDIKITITSYYISYHIIYQTIIHFLYIHPSSILFPLAPHPFTPIISNYHYHYYIISYHILYHNYSMYPCLYFTISFIMLYHIISILYHLILFILS